MTSDTKTVAFRVDASTRIGTGHFMRCLALADCLKSVGAHSRFISRHMPGYLREMLGARGHGFDPLTNADVEETDDLPHSAWLDASQRTDAQQTLHALSGKCCDWLVVDHYALDARWESALRQVTLRVMVIDDLADRVHDCDILLDQNLLLERDARYKGKVPERCQLLLGPRYALLREEFRQMRNQVKPRDGRVKRVLVFFGGVDAGGHTIHAIDALTGVGVDGLQVDVVIGAQNPHHQEIESRCDARGFACHVQTDRMAELMVLADLAIGAGGSTTWERCCLGLPTLTLCVAENQRRLVEDCALCGLISAPAMRSGGSDSIAGHLRALLDNPILLQAMSRNGLHAVDGRGTERVRRAMGCGAIAIREARQADSGRVLAWRNHPDIRGTSGNSDPIDPSAHEEWFAAALADPDRLLLLGEDSKEPVGVVRFDVRNGEAEVSIYLAPELAGEGRGAELLHAAESWLATNRPDVQAVRARVLRDSQNSHRLFEASGYRKCLTQYAKKVGRI